MAPQRTIEQKVGDANQVFNAFREELTPPAIRNMMSAMTPTDPTNMEQNLAFLQGSFQLARLIAANDRAALIAAVMATQSGVSRPVIATDEGGE